MSTVLNIIEQIPAASSVNLGEMVSCIVTGVSRLAMSPSNAWSASLLKFLLRFPVETVEYFVSTDAQVQ